MMAIVCSHKNTLKGTVSEKLNKKRNSD